MPGKNQDKKSANLMVNVYDGTRNLVDKTVGMLVTVIDGNHDRYFRKSVKGPHHYFKDLPYFDNFGDNYTVIVHNKECLQTGFTPVRISPGKTLSLNLMLLPKKGKLNFDGAEWEILKETNKCLFRLLRYGARSENKAKERYLKLQQEQPETVAALLNMATAMSQVNLPEQTPLDYFQKFIWTEMKRDRFFAYADMELLNQIVLAEDQEQWEREIGSALFHEGATRSYKQIQFGEANLQLTFHENDRRRVNNIDCIKVETDMDYYKDKLAHALFEVLPNTLSNQKTDPRSIYLLRWMAGKHAGIPEFNPQYTIV